MSEEIILNRLQAIFREVFEDDLLLIDLGLSRTDVEAWDSLAHIRLIESMEESFQVMFTIDEIESMDSIERMVSFICRK